MDGFVPTIVQGAAPGGMPIIDPAGLDTLLSAGNPGAAGASVYSTSVPGVVAHAPFVVPQVFGGAWMAGGANAEQGAGGDFLDGPPPAGSGDGDDDFPDISDLGAVSLVNTDSLPLATSRGTSKDGIAIEFSLNIEPSSPEAIREIVSSMAIGFGTMFFELESVAKITIDSTRLERQPSVIELKELMRVLTKEIFKFGERVDKVYVEFKLPGRDGAKTLKSSIVPARIPISVRERILSEGDMDEGVVYHRTIEPSNHRTDLDPELPPPNSEPDVPDNAPNLPPVETSAGILIIDETGFAVGEAFAIEPDIPAGGEQAGPVSAPEGGPLAGSDSGEVEVVILLGDGDMIAVDEPASGVIPSEAFGFTTFSEPLPYDVLSIPGDPLVIGSTFPVIEDAAKKPAAFLARLIGVLLGQYPELAMLMLDFTYLGIELENPLSQTWPMVKSLPPEIFAPDRDLMVCFKISEKSYVTYNLFRGRDGLRKSFISADNEKWEILELGHDSGRPYELLVRTIDDDKVEIYIDENVERISGRLLDGIIADAFSIVGKRKYLKEVRWVIPRLPGNFQPVQYLGGITSHSMSSYSGRVVYLMPGSAIVFTCTGKSALWAGSQKLQQAIFIHSLHLRLKQQSLNKMLSDMI